MPRSADPTSYPPIFAEIIRKAYATGEYIVEMPSYKEAKKLAAHLYGYLAAVKRSPNADPEMLVPCKQVAMTVSGTPETAGPCTVKFYNKENGWAATILRDSLGLPSMAEEAAASEARMRAKFLPKEPTEAPDPIERPFTYDEEPTPRETAINKYLRKGGV